jgi:hypothetical protein
MIRPDSKKAGDFAGFSVLLSLKRFTCASYALRRAPLCSVHACVRPFSPMRYELPCSGRLCARSS